MENDETKSIWQKQAWLKENPSGINKKPVEFEQTYVVRIKAKTMLDKVTL